MSQLLDFILAGFAVWRITELFVTDKIMAPVREFFGIAHTETVSLGRVEDKGRFKNFVGDLLSCFRCTSVWAALFVAVLLQFDYPVVNVVLAVFGFSQIAIFMDHVLSRLY